MNPIVRFFFNYIGASVKWIYGLVIRIFIKKPKFTFQEYLHGAKNPNYYDFMGHNLNNGLIGVLTFVFVIVPILISLF
tara:strand:- start:11634 stop:11867 length:234 start_codon:yes stop_codon:yes gene_type:complete